MDHDFLVGVFAVQLGFATPAQVMAASSAWLADRSKGIQERLEADGTIDTTKGQLLQQLVAEALKVHGGDVKKTLHSVGGEQALFRSFGGSVVVDEQGELKAEAAGSSVDRPGNVEESFSVSLEQAGRYALRGGSVDEAEIGRGGLGRVLIAFDEHLGREVAIKELLGEAGETWSTPRAGSGSRTSTVVARFLREARVTGQLEHPNIVPVHEVGQRQDGTFYYSMRVVRGRTLGDKLKDCATLSDRLALLPHYIDICNAVAYAHSRGVVHRDIKPDNVMIGEFGETVVLDWGLAKVRGKKDIRGRELEREVKILHDAGAGKTVDGSAVGTPAYMSPEQAEGRIADIDEQSDVWGLGAVLYEVLTGRPPYEGITPYEILGKVLKDRVAPVRTRNAEAPPELAAVAEKALQHDRSKRYPSAMELAGEVEGFLQGRRVSAYSYSSWELLRRFIEKNKALSAGVTVVLITILASSSVIWLAYGREQVARAAAEDQKRGAIEQRELATTNLAQAYVSAAEQHLRTRSYGRAFLYAAAALRESQRTDRVLTAEQRVALESVLYESKVRRSLTLERSLPGPSGDLFDMALSRDGKLLALVGQRGEIWLHTTDGSRPVVKRTTDLIGMIVQFSSDGSSLLVWFNDGVLRTYDLADLRETRAETISRTMAATWALSGDGAQIALVNMNGEASLVPRKAPESAVPLGSARDVSFSLDGAKLARCTPSGDLVVHDGQSGAVLSNVKVSNTVLGVCRFSQDGRRVLVVSDDGPVIVDLESKSIVARLTGAPKGVGVGSQAADGRSWILGGSVALLWNGMSPAPTELLWEQSASVRTAVSHDGRFVAIGQPGAVRLFRFRTSDRVLFAPTPAAAINAAFSPDGHFAILGDMTGHVQTARFGPDLVVRRLTEHAPGHPADVAISPDGKRVASVGANQDVRVFDTQGWKALNARRLSPLVWGMGANPRIVFSPDGSRLLVTAPDGRVHVLSVDSLALERILAGNLGWPPTLRLAPDGKTLAGGDMFGQVVTWRTDSWQYLRTARTDAGYISDVAITRDGSTVITAGFDGWVRSFALETGAPIRSQRAHDVWVNRLAISADGKLLLTGSDDLTAKLWEVSTGALVRELHLHGQVGATAFSPDGKLMAMGGEGGQYFFPDLRDILKANGEALVAEASRSTGLELDGFALHATGAQAEPEEVSEAVAAGPNEIRGRVQDYFAPDKVVPEGTTVELVHDETELPFSPPRVIPTDKDGNFTLLLPDDIDQFALKVDAQSLINYRHSPRFRRGEKLISFSFASLDEVASLAKPLGIDLQTDKGQILGSVWWSPKGKRSAATAPVGCVALTDERGTLVSYAAPQQDSRLHPDKRLRLLHPGAPFFYLFNLEPGPHKLVARVGQSVVEQTVVARAGSASWVLITFDGEHFPDNPTPPLCLANWPTKADE